MSEILEVAKRKNNKSEQTMARLVLAPESLSAGVLMCCKNFDGASITEVAQELKRQTAAVNSGDMTRAENMLMAQAHTLDGLFANLASRALTAKHLDTLEVFMRLALKAQNQSRATLQTLAELKTPKQIAFVKQANIGNQIQVNNDTTEQSARTRKKKETRNELLEVEHVQRLDTRTKSATGSIDSELATVGEKHWATKPQR